ncbi:MAG: efflux RND transporter periplasmic adaptor subunit [Acidobacteriota bacterium]|nr:efflux RND transporter periplasmic adaptor subunit [Acidobacteriota bacterium]
MTNGTGETPRPDLAKLRIDDRQRGRRPAGRWLLGLAGAVVVIAAAGGAVSLWRDRTVTVTVAAAQAPGPTADARVTLLNASGYVTPRRRATVAAKITGKVTGVYIDEGMRVQQGQLLAQLDDTDDRVALATARADRNATAAGLGQLRVELANARRELARTEGLVKAGIQTEEALDTARTAAESLQAQIAATEAQVKAADARIAVAEQNIANCRVVAPFTGMVVSKDAQPGEMVSPISAGGGYTRTGIATIVDMTSLEIEVDVNENYIARVTPGQPVVATLDAYPDWQIPGRVRAIIPTADREKGTVKVRATFDHLDPRILPDMGVKVAFLGADAAATGGAPPPAAEALVPAAAIRTVGGTPVVFRVRDGVLERRAVRPGRTLGDRVEILAGIAPGDLVVTAGPAALRDGQPVSATRTGGQ